MGEIDMCNFWSRKGEASIAPRVTKPGKLDEVFKFEQLLFLKHLKIRSRSGDIHSQTFLLFPSKIDLSFTMICKLPCCHSPQKPVKEPVQRAKKKRSKLYKLPYTSIAERHTMQVLDHIGKTRAEVAEIMHCSKRTVQRQLKKFKTASSLLDKEKTGRPTKLPPDIADQIVLWIEQDRRNTAPKLKTMVQETFGVEVHERSIRRMLQKKGFFGGVCARKPLLREINKEKRLNFALEHVNKPMEFWQSILFTDEKKV
jgi:transposase